MTSIHPTPVEFMARVRRLEALASRTDPVEYEQWMNEAKAEEMSYLEALEFVVRMQHGGAH